MIFSNMRNWDSLSFTYTHTPCFFVVVYKPLFSSPCWGYFFIPYPLPSPPALMDLRAHMRMPRHRIPPVLVLWLLVLASSLMCTPFTFCPDSDFPLKVVPLWRQPPHSHFLCTSMLQASLLHRLWPGGSDNVFGSGCSFACFCCCCILFY